MLHLRSREGRKGVGIKESVRQTDQGSFYVPLNVTISNYEYAEQSMFRRKEPIGSKYNFREVKLSGSNL